MQYNKCFEDPNLPMEQFAAEVEGKLASGKYTKFIIDLRSNGGGSDGVLYPITYLAQQFLAKGNAVYALEMCIRDRLHPVHLPDYVRAGYHAEHDVAGRYRARRRHDRG